MKIIIFITLLIVNANLYSQTCYSNLGEHTGFLTPSDKTELEAKSCVLKDSFPASFQPNFGVFDWGFYPMNEYMEQNFDALLGDVKSKALSTKPYYLLICRIASSKGQYEKLIVDIKFPQTHEFDCVTDQDITYIKHRIEYKINELKTKSIVEFESLAISMLLDFVEDKKVCCNTGNRNLCGGCLSNEEFSTYMSENDFTVTSAIQLNYAAYTNITPQVKEYAKLTFTKGTETVDVNQTIKDLILELSEITGNIRADIRLADLNGCEASFDLVKEHLFPDDGNIYFHIKVIGQESLLGDQIAIKLETNFQRGGKGTGTIYLKNLDNNYSYESIVSKTLAFFSVAGLKMKIKPLTNNSKIGLTDAFCVISKSRKRTIDFIFNNKVTFLDVSYHDDPVPSPSEYFPDNVIECDHSSSLRSWPETGTFTNEERSTNRAIAITTENLTGTGFSMDRVYTNASDDNKLRVAGGLYRCLAFLIIHSTSHNAGFSHPKKNGNSLGYADSGNFIANILHFANSAGMNTFEKLILDTKKSYPHITKQTNARYGY